MEMLLMLYDGREEQTAAAHGTTADVMVDNRLPWRQQWNQSSQIHLSEPAYTEES